MNMFFYMAPIPIVILLTTTLLIEPNVLRIIIALAHKDVLILFLLVVDSSRNPTLAKCGGEAQLSQSWGLGVLRDSRMFRVRQQGPKLLALRRSWCH
jgi:hypothetical protein